MKKVQLYLMVGMSTIVLAGCQPAATPTTTSSESSTEQKMAQEAVIVLKEDGKEIEKKTVQFSDESLYDVMKQNFDIEDDNGFITSINGKKQDTEAKKYWLYYINDKMAEKGAKETYLQPGDVVEFRLGE